MRNRGMGGVAQSEPNLGPDDQPFDSTFGQGDITVRVLTENDDRQVTAFLDRLGQHDPGVLGYHYPFYRDMLLRIGVGEPTYLGAFEEDQIVGVLPAFRRRGEAGVVCSSLPFFGPNAGVSCARNRAAEVHAQLLQAMNGILADENAISCSIYTPFLKDEYSAYERAFAGALIVNKFTQHTPLENACWETRVVGSIRKAHREGVEVSEEVTPERVEGLFEIYRQNCQATGTPPKPRACLEYLTRPEVRGRFTEVYFAFRAGTLIAGLIVVLGPSTVSYFLPCTLAEARSFHPGSLLIEHAMNRARASGRRYWNWESSPSRDSGVYLFKRGWGAIESRFRIYCVVNRDRDFFARMGAAEIARQYPYYFVYPFDRLNAEVAEPALTAGSPGGGPQ